MRFAQKNFHKKLLGKVGENKAAAHLKKLGYKIVEKNYENAFGEIDIIATDGEYTVFVEVKTRSDDCFGVGSEAVDFKKRQKYAKIALYYLTVNKKTESPCRFDVVEIQDGKINHIKDAFSL